VKAAAVAVLAGGLLWCAPAGAAPPAVSGQLLVGFDKGVSKDRQEQVLGADSGRISERFRAVREGRLAVVRPRSGTSLRILRQRLSRRPEVAYAERDFFNFASAKTPDDPLYSSQYALGDSPDDYDIDAPDAWGTRTGCAKVAVLDTGVDFDHPDLKANIVESKDKPGDGKDNDKNGYVDDAHGFDVIKGKGSGNDDEGHGTHVAGIVAGRGNNGTGVAGVCWSGKVLPVKFLDSRGRGSTSDAIAGIEYAVKAGVKIINCSFGTSGKSEALHDAVKFAKKKNALLIVAAGNDGENIDKSPEYPAAFNDDNILAVAASTSKDKLASFSNFGSEEVDVAAPGEDIRSTYLDGGYRVLSGTSMAAPFAAGVAALLKKQESDATYEDLRYVIRRKVDKPPALDGKVAYDGRLNARKALNAIGDRVD
jgi:subtilisin family serine protease